MSAAGMRAFLSQWEKTPTEINAPRRCARARYGKSCLTATRARRASPASGP